MRMTSVSVGEDLGDITETEFIELDVETKLNLIMEMLTASQKMVTALAKKIVIWQERIGKNDERVKSLSKTLNIAKGQRDMVKNILKGRCKSFGDKNFWGKEKDVTKKLSERPIYLV